MKINVVCREEGCVVGTLDLLGPQEVLTAQKIKGAFKPSLQMYALHEIAGPGQYLTCPRCKSILCLEETNPKDGPMPIVVAKISVEAKI
jgi:hypothetical protein